jgi:hypothetical protein
MLDVHPPHHSPNTWRDFFLHIATIVIGLLIAIGLEQTVEFFHHRHQAHEALDMLRREFQDNRSRLREDVLFLNLQQRQHRTGLAVLHRLRVHALDPGDRLIFVRPYTRFSSSAWKTAHESGATAYIPYNLLAIYGDIYQSQETIDTAAAESNLDLLHATSVLNGEKDDTNPAGEDLYHIDMHNPANFSQVTQRLSGDPDLAQLSSTQIDRLEAGFQQAISDDRRLSRLYVFLGFQFDDLLNHVN